MMPHGFVSFNFPVFGMRDESLEGIRVAQEWLKELLEYEDSSENDKERKEIEKI